MEAVREVVTVYGDLIFGYFVFVSVVYVALVVISSVTVAQHIRGERYAGLDDIFTSPLTPGISLLVPAYNEEAGIVESVRSLLNLRYPHYEVIVVNDGSKDATVEVLKREFELRRVDAVYAPRIVTAQVRGIYYSPAEPFLTVVDKANGGRSDAINCGINLARCPLICTVDADSVLEPDALLWAVKPFVDEPELVVAAGGGIGVANGVIIERGSVTQVRLPRSPLAMFQVVEYFRAFLAGRTTWSRLNSLMIISGAFGIFRRDLVLELGGYRLDTVGEDAELTAHIHQHLSERRIPYKIAFVSEVCCWTEAPESLRVLRSQRRRWHKGLAEFLWMHRGLCNPRYGAIALLGYPYFALIEFLGPVVEAMGYVIFTVSLLLGLGNEAQALLLLVLTLGYGVLITAGTLMLEEFSYHHYTRWNDMLRLFLFAFLESFGYRQLTVLWRLEGLLDLIRRKKGWGVMERKGLSGASGGTP